MPKEAVTESKMNQLLMRRWSPRAFDSKPIEIEKLKSMLEAARWAPSASNLQPWVFFVGLKGDEVYQKIFDTLVEFNQMWAVNAPVLILNCGKTTTNDEAINGVWQYDLGQAVAHMSIEAMDKGIYVHQMGGFDPQKATELFKLPEHTKAVSVLAAGYIGDPSILHPRMQKSEMAPRERKELNTFVFSATYEVNSTLIK